MSGRPRLVEEGTPIYQGVHDNRSEIDQWRSRGLRPNGQTQTFDRRTDETRSQRKTNIATHIVIGDPPRLSGRKDDFGDARMHDDTTVGKSGHICGTSLAQAALKGGRSAPNDRAERQKRYPQTNFMIGEGGFAVDHDHEGSDANTDTSEEAGGQHHIHWQQHPLGPFAQHHFSHDHTRQHAAKPIAIGGEPPPSPSQEESFDHAHMHHYASIPMPIQQDRLPPVQLRHIDDHRTQTNTQCASAEAHRDSKIHNRKERHAQHHYFSHDHTKHHDAIPITIGGHVPHYFSHDPVPSRELTQQSRYSANHVDDDDAESRMELDDIIPKEPLIVIDGANVAYAYADANANLGPAGTFSRSGTRYARAEPDSRGIDVAARYFLNGGCRVQVVIPAGWLRAKPRPGDANRDNALMETPQLEALRGLKERNMVCAAPPADDDDAYAIAIARREDSRARRRGGEKGGGYVLSNDFFRDAILRDGRSDGSGTGLKRWLDTGSGRGPGRISYSFLNMDSANAYGDHELDFMPNPRHPLIERIEHVNRSNELPIS